MITTFLQKMICSFLILCSTLYQSQTVTVQGIAKDSLGRMGMAISVNDTLRKFRDKAFKDKNWDGYDQLVNNKVFSTYPDSAGNYSITAKPTDTLYFYKRKYITQKYKVADIIKHNIKVFLKPMPCVSINKCNQETPSKLYIFVGKKMKVTTVDTSKYCEDIVDSEYKGEYKIEQELGDHYPSSEITFNAFDHISKFEYDFRNYDNVLTFIGEYCGDLIQMKYQFFPVYKTVDGRWATPVDTYMERYYKSENNQPTAITFDQSIYFNLPGTGSGSDEQITLLKQFKFPEKYYRIENGKVIPIAGRYVEDSVKLWKATYRQK